MLLPLRPLLHTAVVAQKETKHPLYLRSALILGEATMVASGGAVLSLSLPISRGRELELWRDILAELNT